MSLAYKDEYIASPDGTMCQVLDVKRVDFAKAAEGRKTAPTLVICAQGGEEICTRNRDGQTESVYRARRGDALFINPHNSEDIYVPADPDGTRWAVKDLIRKGYVIVGEDQDKGGILVRRNTAERLLHEAVTWPSCIKDAFGVGAHQFLYPGATLKQDENGHISGINKSAFDATWEILPPGVSAKNAQPNTPPCRNGGRPASFLPRG